MQVGPDFGLQCACAPCFWADVDALVGTALAQEFCGAGAELIESLMNASMAEGGR